MEKIIDYSPWCIVYVYTQYITIETLHHEDNTYPTTQKHFWMMKSTRQLLNVLKAVFEQPQINTYGQINVIKATKKQTYKWNTQSTKQQEQNNEI